LRKSSFFDKSHTRVTAQVFNMVFAILVVSFTVSLEADVIGLSIESWTIFQSCLRYNECNLHHFLLKDGLCLEESVVYLRHFMEVVYWLQVVQQM